MTGEVRPSLNTLAFGLDPARSSIAESAVPAVLNPIDAIDLWARHIWRHKRSSLWVVLAVPLWLAIRLGYRIAYLAGKPAYYVAAVFKWIYWRLYEVCGPIARFGKRIFWRLYALGGPAGRLCKTAYWRLIYPVFERAWALARWIYWRTIFPIAEHPARWMGFSLLGSRPASKPDAAAPVSPSLTTLGENDALIWIARALSDFEALFDCLPRFGLSTPVPGNLYIWMGPDMAALDPQQIRLIGLRLRSGAPMRRVFFYAPDTETAAALERDLAAPVHVAAGTDAVEFTQLVRQRAFAEAPSLIVERFGPIVLLISALWGRVGSTLIFDAQTQLLIESGAIVVRVFVDHYPGHGAEGVSRRNALLLENFTATSPHLHVVAERDQSHRTRSQLHKRRDYIAASAVRRLELELASAKPLDEGVMRWSGAAARLCIVNHAMHMAFAEGITSAPIVLETHDVLTHQMESHGWPSFVSLAKEPKHLRDSDQQAIWKRAKACVNLSPEDQTAIAPHAQASTFVRPTAAQTTPRLRPWAEVVRANALSPEFAASEEIDVLLWGDWHEGNVRAVQWIIQEVRTARPELESARIAIVGRVTRLLPHAILKAPNVVSCGFVDRLDDFFGRAKVLAIADQEGSGISIKAIEALRHGLPFVSTWRGMRGLDISDVGFEPPKTAEAFAADVATMLASETARGRRAALATALYERNISHAAYESEWRRIVALADPEFMRADNAPLLARAPKVLAPGPSSRIAPVAAKVMSAAPKQCAIATAPSVLKRSTHALAAVICTYNRYDVLPGAIESLLAQDVAADDLDILVIDNSPDQEAAAAFGARYRDSRVRYMLEPIPGLSNARNVGAHASGAKYVAYIDDDAVAASDWARKLLASLQQFNPRAGVAGGRIVPRWVTPRPDWLPDELVGNLSIVDWGGVARPLGRTEWIAGCNIAFDRQTLLEVGGFSRALGRVGSGAALLSNEESEVIEKFAEVDRIAIYAPEATVEHLIEPARLSQDWFRRRAAWQAVSDYIKDPKKAAAYSGAAAERLRRELAAKDNVLPPGFVHPNAEREAFRRDVGLMYDIVIAMLAGGVELSGSGSNASLHDTLVASVRREVQRSPQLRAAIRKLANH